MAISTNGAIITRLAGALYGEYLSNATYKEVSATDPSVLAASWLKADFGSKTDTQIATTILTNLNLSSVAGLSNWLAAQLTAAGSAGKGAKVVSLLNDFAGMTADTTYGAQATAFNTKVSAALTKSQTADSAGGSFATADAVAPVVASAFALTTGADVADNVSSTRGALSSTFNFTSGNDTVTGTVNTLTTTDVLVDSSATDNDTLTVAISAATDASGASFTTENIETFNITAGAGGNGDLDMTNVSGLKNLNVTGSGNFTISDLNAQTLQPTIAVNNYTRVLTIAPDTHAGTTKGENPETVNISVSGASYGTVASAQTAVVIDAATAGVLETLNINSAGTAANEFALSAGTSDTFETINFTGTTAITARVAAADVSGVVVSGAAGSKATLMVNRDTASTLDATNFSGVTIAMYDATPTEADYANVTLKDGAGVTLLNNFAATTSTVQGALYTALAGSTSVTLDHSKDNTNVTVASLGIQNVKAITITSSGNAAEDTVTNKITSLTGDFSTITINGDTPFQTSLTIDGVQTASGTDTARAVTVTAAGMTGTAFANITTGATSLYTSYSITGTANDDTLSVKDTSTLGATLTGGAGNDTLTGALGNDTISGGDGDDTINTSFGADKVTGGAGADTIVLVDDFGSATAQVSKVSGLASIFENGGNADLASATADDLVVTIDGVNYQVSPASNGHSDATIYAKFVADHGSAISAAHGITAAVQTVADTYTVDFVIANIGTAVAGDTIVVDVNSSTDDQTFTRNSSGGWDNSSTTSKYSLSVAGSEVTVTNSTTTFTLIETGSIVTLSGTASAIALGTDATVTTETEAAVTLSNDYLKLTGRTDGTTFTVSSTWYDDDVAKLSTVSSSTATAAVAQPDLTTTITDFATNDVLDLSTGSFMSGDVVLATSLNATNLDTANVILLTTGTGYATVTTAEAAVNTASGASSGAAIIVFLNTTTGKVQAFYDGNVGLNTIDTTLEIAQATLFTFDNLTSLVGISSTFTADSFIFA